uniref:DUF4371 domain-containing protein n=1 Tax=Anopheles dirus TaxID=7168 RepID=A0A182NT06_9DIPT
MQNCVATKNGHVVCSVDAINGCKYRQRSDKYDPGNFIRHIRTAHPALAKSHGLMQEETSAPVKQRKISKVSVAIDRQKLLEGIIKLICTHNVPMLCVEWEGLGIILQPICDALKMQLNRSNLVCHLGAAAQKIRLEISSIVKGKLLCLKIDSATRLGRHILGINIQFCDPEQNDIVIYTIGMVELNDRHTGKFLKAKIMEILVLYEISLDQIFTVTCDNGANMIAAVKQLQSDLQIMINPLEDTNGRIDQSDHVDVTETIEKEFHNIITLVRCAVHTMQLSVVDVIKAFDAEIRKCTLVSNKKNSI